MQGKAQGKMSAEERWDAVTLVRLWNDSFPFSRDSVVGVMADGECWHLECAMIAYGTEKIADVARREGANGADPNTQADTLLQIKHSMTPDGEIRPWARGYDGQPIRALIVGRDDDLMLGDDADKEYRTVAYCNGCHKTIIGHLGAQEMHNARRLLERAFPLDDERGER